MATEFDLQLGGVIILCMYCGPPTPIRANEGLWRGFDRVIIPCFDLI